MELKDLMPLVDELSAVETERLALDRKSNGLKAQAEKLKANLIAEMQRHKISEIAGEGGRIASLKVSNEPVASDWQKLHTHIRETGELDLLHRRLTVSAVKLRWEEGVNIPGVDMYVETKLVLT